MNREPTCTLFVQSPQPVSGEALSSRDRTRLLLQDDHLSEADKRKTLASWASDSRAVADQPSLRVLDDGTIVFVEDILEALKSLGNDAVRAMSPWSPHANGWATMRRRPAASTRWIKKLARRRADDDDDPPPCPSGSVLPLGRGPMSDGARALAEVC